MVKFYLQFSAVLTSLICVSNANSETISEAFTRLGPQTKRVAVDLSGSSTIVDEGGDSAGLSVSTVTTRAIASADCFQAFAVASDDGPGPRVDVEAVGGGFVVLADDSGNVIEYSGDIVVRFANWTLVGAGDKLEGPGSLHGYADAGFSSGPYGGFLDLVTNITTHDRLTIGGVLTGIPGTSSIYPNRMGHTHLIESGRLISLNSGVGEIGFRAYAGAQDATNALGDHMPGPALGVSAIRIDGIEWTESTGLPTNASLHWACGDSLVVSPIDLGTSVIELSENPFDEVVPEPTTSTLALVGLCWAFRRR